MEFPVPRRDRSSAGELHNRTVQGERNHLRDLVAIEPELTGGFQSGVVRVPKKIDLFLEHCVGHAGGNTLIQVIAERFHPRMAILIILSASTPHDCACGHVRAMKEVPTSKGIFLRRMNSGFGRSSDPSRSSIPPRAFP
jgi:hypothetical protein